MAITWRNVDAPHSAGALNALNQAARSIGGAFTGLQDTLRGAELADKDRLDRVRSDNTASFMDALYSQYRTPEAIAQAQQSGAIDQLRASYGNLIDRDKTRGAAEARQNALQQQDLTRRQYNNQVIDDNDAAGLSRAQMFALQGNQEAAQKEIDALNARNQGKGATLAFDAEGRLISRDQAAEKHKWQGQTTQSQLASAAQQRTLTGLKIDEAKLAVEDAAQRRAGEDAGYGIVQQYQANVAKNHNGMALLADQLGIPVTNGRVDMNRITSDQKEYLTKAAKASGFDPSILDGGDTAFIQKQRDSIAAMDIPRRQKEAMLNAISGANTSGVSEAGSDLERRSRNELALQAEQEKFGSLHEVPVATTEWEPYMKVINDNIDKGDTNYREAVTNLLRQGFIKGEGNSRWNPSPGELAVMLNSGSKSWYKFDGYNADDLRDMWAKDPRTLSNLSQAANLGNIKRAQTLDRKAAEKK